MKKTLFATLIVFVLFFTSCVSGNSSERICAPTLYGRHEYKKVEHKDPTCTEEGYDLFECSVCGMIRTGKIATAHEYCKVDWKFPTCTAAGYTTYKCSKCGYTSTERVAPKHNFYWESDSMWIDYYMERCRDCGKYSGRIKDHGKIHEL